jgi:hypothetical protein
MSDSPDRVDDITFIVGKGNQSAICGGVTPMKVVDPKAESNARPTDASTPAEAGRRDA